MKKSKNRIVSLVASLILLSSLCACGNPSSTSSNSEGSNISAETKQAASLQEYLKEANASTEPFEFTHFVNFDWWMGSGWGETTAGKWFSEHTGAKMDVVKAKQSDSQELNILMSTGDLPDVITLDINDALLGQLIKKGDVWDLNELIDKEVPALRNYIPEEMFKYHSTEDGKFCYITNFMRTAADLENPDYRVVDESTQLFFIREDVFEAIGKPEIKTPDDFVNMLAKIKEKFPDLIPLYTGPYAQDSSWFKTYGFGGNLSFMNQFGLSKYVNDNSKITSVVRTENFKNYLKFMNDIYNEGYWDETSFVDSTEVRDTKYATGQYAVLASDHSTVNTVPKDVCKYVALDCFDSAKITKADSGWTATVISKNAKNPERILKALGWLLTPEGEMFSSVGVEGVHSKRLENGILKVTDDFRQKTIENPKIDETEGSCSYIWFKDSNWCLMPLWTDESQFTAQEVQTWQDRFADHFKSDVFLGLMDPKGDTDEGVILAKLHELAQNYMPKIIMAKDNGSSMAEYQDFIDQCQSLGLEKVENYWTAKYKSFNK